MVRKAKLLLIFLVALTSVVAGAAWRLKGLMTPQATDIKQKVEFDERTGTINILAMGVDDVEGVHRSDTVALITVDIDNKRIKVMSLPRDTRTSIRGRGTQKLNHAFAFGGVDLLKETVVNLLGLPIHYDLMVNYESFPEIVDALGGIEIDVKKNLRYKDRAGHLNINIKKGWRHLDGKTALEFVRFRHDALGDIGRIRRQQQFLKAVLKKLYSPALMDNMPEITKKILAMVSTNISATQAIQLTSYLKDIPSERISFFTLPGKPTFINGLSYWTADLAKASTMLTSSRDIPDEEKGADISSTPPQEVMTINEPVAVLNGDGTSGLSRKVSSALEKKGIEVTYIGNAKHFDYHYSNIVHRKGDKHRNNALALASLCGVDAKLVKEDNDSGYNVAIIIGHDKNKIIPVLEK